MTQETGHPDLPKKLVLNTLSSLLTARFSAVCRFHQKFWTEQGILTMVKTLSQIGGNTTLIIENYINNAYNTWTIPPATILLLGDFGSDINSTVISPFYDNYCASDNIYGDVNNDQLPDIVMARITANNEAQLQVMVSKFLNYERNPPTSASFYDHPITALGWQTERWFQLCSETVGGYWKNVQGKNPVRINEIYDGIPGTAWSTAPNTSTVVSYFGPAGLDISLSHRPLWAIGVEVMQLI